jgi:hypothetical protein
MSKKPEFNEAMDIYYKVKNEYYEKRKEYKNSIRNDQTLTLKEKRAKFANIKLKCINCSKSSGTIFKELYDPETLVRHLIVKCGDTRNPCELSINIAVGHCDLLTNYINGIESSIEENKQNVIKDKNNMLFGYITSVEALKLFDKYKKNITEDTEILESTLTDYDNATLTKSKLIEIKKIQSDIYANINEIKTQMGNFVRTNNTQSIKNAVAIYIDRLLPLNKSLIEHKYKTSFVEYNDTTQEYHLIQKENTINSLELCFESSVKEFQISSYLTNENVAKQNTTTKKKKPENEENDYEKDEKKQAKKDKEREKEEKKKAKEDKEQAKKDKEREKEEKKKAKEEKKKNKQSGGNDDSSSSSSEDNDSSSSSSEDDDSSDEEEEIILLEDEPALTEYEEPLSA